MKNVFVVHVVPEASVGHVSGEAYTTLAKAQEFIKSRSDKPEPISSHLFRSSEYTSYYICEVSVV